MVQTLNLIPQEEVQTQTKEKAVKLSTVLSIIILIVIALISAYFAYYTYSLRTQIAKIQTETATLREQVTASSSIEILARNLDKKYTALRTMLSSRVYYSLLMQELRSRTPFGVTVQSFDFHGSTLNLAGTAPSYQIFADFMTNLLNKNYGAGNADLKELFTSVKLNSLSLLSSGTTVNYAIEVTFDVTKLKKPL